MSRSAVITAPSKVKDGSRKTGVTVRINIDKNVIPADIKCLFIVSLDMVLL